MKRYITKKTVPALFVLLAVCLVAGLLRRSDPELMTASVGMRGYLRTVENFEDYDPPNYLVINKYDYMTENGNASQNPDDIPTWQASYPYRAMLLGARYETGVSSGGQNHNVRMWYIFSKKPSIDCIDFEYSEYKNGTAKRDGYIKADISRGLEDGTINSHGYFGTSREPDVVILYTGGSGVNKSFETFSCNLQNNQLSTFYFDFIYWPCCGDLNVKGLTSVSDCPYPYILTCTNPDGTGGGSSWPEGGGNNGGGTDPGDGGGGTDPGDGGGGTDPGGKDPDPEWPPIVIVPPDIDEDVKPWNPDKDYEDWEPDEDWEDGTDLPEIDYNEDEETGTTGDDGEQGDTWKLPGFTDPDVTGEAEGFQEIQPGPGEQGIEDWGIDAERGVYDLEPGVNDWGYSDWGGGAEQGLYDVMDW